MIQCTFIFLESYVQVGAIVNIHAYLYLFAYFTLTSVNKLYIEMAMFDTIFSSYKNLFLDVDKVNLLYKSWSLKLRLFLV